MLLVPIGYRVTRARLCSCPGSRSARCPAWRRRSAITSYSTGEGLVGAYVSAVLRDSRGFVWFGTRDGVSRFDGVRFVNDGVEDGLSDPTVNDVLESRAGDHWMATNGSGASARVSSARRAMPSSRVGFRSAGVARLREGRFTVFYRSRSWSSGRCMRMWGTSVGRRHECDGDPTSLT
jgi:hypothetical protein